MGAWFLRERMARQVRHGGISMYKVTEPFLKVCCRDKSFIQTTL